jgi:glycine oxidase
MRSVVDVAVVGGGVIGLSVAWRAARHGLNVMVCDPQPGRGTSWVAAGMLAPSTEARWAEGPLHQLNAQSAGAWPEFAALVEADSGLQVGLRTEGTLSVAVDRDDHEALDDDVAVQRAMGCTVESLTGRECRQLEPSLSPAVTGGALNAVDHQVDTRALLPALLRAGRNRGVQLRHTSVRAVRRGPSKAITGVVLADGTPLAAGAVVLAAGCDCHSVGGFLPFEVPSIRPVKGQILRLRSDPSVPLLHRTVRAQSQGRAVYLVPRRSGEIVVGATVEERGRDRTVTAGAVHDLLRAACAAVPDIAELPLSEASAGLRPCSEDNGPLLGASTTHGLFLAAGHFRHGVLLAPATAEALADSLAGRSLSGPAAAFSATRFGVRAAS